MNTTALSTVYCHFGYPRASVTTQCYYPELLTWFCTFLCPLHACINTKERYDIVTRCSYFLLAAMDNTNEYDTLLWKQCNSNLYSLCEVHEIKATGYYKVLKWCLPILQDALKKCKGSSTLWADTMSRLIKLHLLLQAYSTDLTHVSSPSKSSKCLISMCLHTNGPFILSVWVFGYCSLCCLY